MDGLFPATENFRVRRWGLLPYLPPKSILLVPVASGFCIDARGVYGRGCGWVGGGDCSSWPATSFELNARRTPFTRTNSPRRVRKLRVAVHRDERAVDILKLEKCHELDVVF